MAQNQFETLKKRAIDDIKSFIEIGKLEVTQAKDFDFVLNHTLTYLMKQTVDEVRSIQQNVIYEHLNKL